MRTRNIAMSVILLFVLPFMQVARAELPNNNQYNQGKFDLMIITKTGETISYINARNGLKYSEAGQDWYITRGGKKITEPEFLKAIGQNERANQILQSMAGVRLADIIGGGLLLIGGTLFWTINDTAITNAAVSMIVAGISIGIFATIISRVLPKHYLTIEEVEYQIGLYNAQLMKEPVSEDKK